MSTSWIWFGYQVEYGRHFAVMIVVMLYEVLYEFVECFMFKQNFLSTLIPTFLVLWTWLLFYYIAELLETRIENKIFLQSGSLHGKDNVITFHPNKKSFLQLLVECVFLNDITEPLWWHHWCIYHCLENCMLFFLCCSSFILPLALPLTENIFHTK